MIADPNYPYPIPFNPLWNVFDPSKVETWLTCPRQYFYKHILGWKNTAPNNHLIFGEAMHKALEHMLLNKTSEGYPNSVITEAFQKFLDSYRQELPEETDELYTPKTPANMLGALSEYAGRWGRDDAPLEVLYTEVAGSIPISPSRSIFYRVDAIVYDPTKDIVFSLEHKSGSRINRQWQDKWALHNQPFSYTHVLYSIFDPKIVKGVKINGIHFIKRKTDPIEFIRIPCWKRPPQMNEWLWEINDIFDQMEYEFFRFSNCSPDDIAMRAFPKNPEACTKYFGCPYHDYCCAWENPLSRCDEVPYEFQVEHWDPRDQETTHRKDFTPEQTYSLLNVGEEGNGEIKEGGDDAPV